LFSTRPGGRRQLGGLVWVTSVALLVGLVACGQADSGLATTTASAARSASPSTVASPSASAEPVPDATRLTAANCSGAAATSAPRLLGRYYTVSTAPNWTDTGNYQQTETLLLELTAPQAYGLAPTRIQFLSDLGAVHVSYGAGATAHSIAQRHAASIANETAPAEVAGTVRDCTVGGDPAAAFGYSNGSNTGYRLYVVHGDLLFEVILDSVGGVGDQATQDSLGMIGSLKWAF
jgi:hypothetical protein